MVEGKELVQAEQSGPRALTTAVQKFLYTSVHVTAA